MLYIPTVREMWDSMKEVKKILLVNLILLLIGAVLTVIDVHRFRYGLLICLLSLLFFVVIYVYCQIPIRRKKKEQEKVGIIRRYHSDPNLADKDPYMTLSCSESARKSSTPLPANVTVHYPIKSDLAQLHSNIKKTDHRNRISIKRSSTCQPVSIIIDEQNDDHLTNSS